MRLQYIGPFAKPTGFGRAMHDYAMALLQAGVEMQIEPLVDCDTDELEPRYKGLLKFLRQGADTDRTWPTHVMVHSIPRYAHEWVSGLCEYPKSTRKILMTAWETDRVEAADADRILEHFDLVIVPSPGDAAAFQDAGLRNVVVVPHCYDPDFWRAPKGGPDATSHLFYSIGVWSYRKNLEGVVRAYVRAFKRKDRVLLTLVCPNADADRVRDLRGEDGPAIDILPRIDETILRRLHYACHTYVSMARGEGWGLGAFEAAIVGNRVIATPWGGHAAFLADYERFAPVGFDVVHLDPTPGQVELGMSAEQRWAEPDVDHAAAIMHGVYRRGRGVRQPAPWAEKYGYDVVGKQLLEVLQGG